MMRHYHFTSELLAFAIGTWTWVELMHQVEPLLLGFLATILTRFGLAIGEVLYKRTVEPYIPRRFRKTGKGRGSKPGRPY